MVAGDQHGNETATENLNASGELGWDSTIRAFPEGPIMRCPARGNTEQPTVQGPASNSSSPHTS
jgi:hypothetical protein